MTAKQPYLKINNLVKKFGQFTALKQISLAIEKGEFVCFLGPSGCGKTTLLRAIAGLDLATDGVIVQDGDVTTFLPPEKRDFGIVFQSYALFPNLTVFENIAVGLRNKGVRKEQCKADVSRWLELIGLPDSGLKYPNQLSGGQQQRVALARALALSPGLLLLDEPLSALDAKVRVHLREEICQLQRELGITTIMVTHDQEEALSMADRIVVMNHGVIEQVGTPEEIYERPATRFVAEFVGSMNFVPVTVESGSQINVAGSLMPIPSLTNHQVCVGEHLELAIRPENFYFSERSEGCIPVRIEHIEFQGTYLSVECSTVSKNTDIRFMVDVPVREARPLALKLHDVRYLSICDTEECTAELHAFLPNEMPPVLAKAV